MRRRDVLGIALLALGGGPAQSQTHSTLDRSTGATITVSEKPWMLALDQPHLAANARDYIAIHAMQINTAGKRRLFLATFYWSTIPGRGTFVLPEAGLLLRVEDRQLQLQPAGTPHGLGMSRWPLKPPARDASLVVYEADTGLIRQLAVAHSVRARPDTAPALPGEIWFEPWRDGRDAFASFAAATTEPR